VAYDILMNCGIFFSRPLVSVYSTLTSPESPGVQMSLCAVCSTK